MVHADPLARRRAAYRERTFACHDANQFVSIKLIGKQVVKLEAIVSKAARGVNVFSAFDELGDLAHIQRLGSAFIPAPGLSQLTMTSPITVTRNKN